MPTQTQVHPNESPPSPKASDFRFPKESSISILTTSTLAPSASAASKTVAATKVAIKPKTKATKRWRRAITKVKMMNMLGSTDAKETFRKHRESVRVQGTKRMSFHNSVLTSSKHVQKLDEKDEMLKGTIPAYRRCSVLVVPMTKQHNIWLGVQMCLTLCTMILTPWLSGFGLSSSSENLTAIDTMAITSLLYVLDIFAVVDMISVCCTGYFDREQARIVLRSYQATRHYILSQLFLCDLLSVFPFEFFAPRESLSFRCLLLRRMFRLWRGSGTWTFINYLQHSVVSNSSLFPILKLMAIIVYISHFFACMLQLVRYAENTYGLPSQLDDYSHPDDSSLYTKSLYETIYLLLGESLSDVYTKNERVFVYLCVLMGAVLNAWLFGQVAIYVDSMMRDSLGYQALMHDVHSHMDSLNLPSDVRSRVLSYFDFLWSRNKSGSDRKSFMDKISPSLRAEISLYQHRELISRVDFFHSAPVGFIVDVAMRLDSKLFLPGDFVIREDDFGTEMYFVVSGSCQCLVKSKVVRIFHANDMFGEIALLKAEPVRRTATIKSELYSELVVLAKTDFLDCLGIHPDAAKGVYAVMREKIDGYTGANRKRLNRSASVDVRENIANTVTNSSDDDSRIKKMRKSSYIKSLSSRSSAVKTGTTLSPSNHGGGDISLGSPIASLYDSALTVDEFVDNRSAQFGIKVADLIQFAQEYSIKLHTQEKRERIVRQMSKSGDI
jgi:CRP-like cAMP-binding protein